MPLNSTCFSCGYDVKPRSVIRHQDEELCYQIECPQCLARTKVFETTKRAEQHWDNLCVLSAQQHYLFLAYSTMRGEELCELLHMVRETQE
jgi:hypothetical protein